MAALFDLSGSEDGQLESPSDERFSLSGDEEHDGDSLDIKPPQANVAHSRDSTGSKRKEKIPKEKKHSKEKKHRSERSGRERERGVDREKEVRERDGRRNSDLERNRVEHRRDERNDMERYHQRGGYERDESGSREMMANNDRRYQKHYDQRNIEGGGRNSSGGVGYHHQHYHQHPQQMHMQRQRQDYYDRGPNYQHNAGAEYYGNRHQQYSGKHSHIEYGHGDMAFDMQRDRRKYNYESQKDPESIEQDLRSRLLSKRHKYVKGKDSDTEDQYETTGSQQLVESRSLEERAAKAERHRRRREKERAPVIEVLDSPEIVVEEIRQRKKHKRRNKEVEAVETPAAPTEKRKLPDDPELLARRAKILAAEREKEKRKQELEARRELKRAKSALSPSAVAASVTAGLNVVKRKKHSEGVHRSKRKRAKKSAKNEASDVEMDDDEENDDDEKEGSELEDDSQSGSDSASDSTEDEELEKHYKKSKASKKKKAHSPDNSDDDVQLPESPLSIGELSKSPKRHRKKKSKRSKTAKDNNERPSRSPSEHSRSRSATRSSSPLRTSRSRTHSASRSRSHSRSSVRSRTRSHSVSRSLSSHSRSRSLSRSRSKSRSRSRSEERHMRARKSDIEMKELTNEIAKKSVRDGVESPVRDEKGAPLPNYYPGIQGCRSVEEFQCLNRIEEGTYGVVYRAKDKRTSEIVALKRLKMEKEKEGFPITSLREINTLLKGQHPNIVTVREIVVGSNMDKIFIVMDYVEHDLKSLMETMKTRKQFFLPGEVKCLTQQLLRAVGHLHDNWILHRDLKTSNLLLSHKGILKVGDFGLAREYGSPLKKYTSLVVTLWYRAPELLLCSPEYSTPIDIWSVGCIFAEFLQMAPMFPGKTEVEELHKIFKELGTPNDRIWPGYKDLPAVRNMVSQNSQFADYPISNLRKRFSEKTTDLGIELLQGLLTYDPKQRLTADKALKHDYFKELPLPIDPSMFPTWPAKSELGARKALISSPKPPSGGSQFKQLGRDDVIVGSAAGAAGAAAATSTASNSKVMSGIITGNKKTAANTGFVLNAGIDQRQLAMGPGFNLKF